MPPHHLSPIKLGITLTSTRNIASELIVFWVPSDVIARCIFLIIFTIKWTRRLNRKLPPNSVNYVFSYDIVFMHVSGSVHAKKNATTFLIFTSETTLLRDSATRKEVLKTSWKTSMEFDIVLCFDLRSI